MSSRRNVLIKRYFEDHSIVEANLKSFNNFIEKYLQKAVDSVGDIIPTIIPQDMQDFKIRFGKISVGKPAIIEADGSRVEITPAEARLRKITYSAPIDIEVSVYINGIQRESYTTQIGKIPIMLKSKKCNYYGLNKEELIKRNEDPDDPGGYFIINGNERVLITVEDLASNKFFVQENSVGPSKFTGKLFSESGIYRIPHVIEQMKDGIIYLSFTRFKRIPIINVIKALGLTNDREITELISGNKQYDDIYINLYSASELKNDEDAQESLAKKIYMTQPREIKLEKVKENLDKFLLPHIGIDERVRIAKAKNLCKIVKMYLMVSREGLKLNDKDHYSNKRLKLSGDLLLELFRTNMIVLVNDILYNFQRLVKRGKLQSTKIIIREKLLTSRVKSAMATGAWTGGRKGVSQNADRTNFMSFQSNLQRVISLLSASQENFQARAIHSTHWGRLCPIETPEGTPIGLRKNTAMLCEISQETVEDNKIIKSFEKYGLKD
ncbi:DNA-directed RNA polymerase subunit B'' [Candidatus Woesearchaeota archaeon]|nr:DNA-directed RNA polymerase subunit B'' [Candidatus Woesearchaeota archaeon]